MIRRGRWCAALAAAAGGLALLGAGPADAAINLTTTEGRPAVKFAVAAADRLGGARQALGLTEQRLSLMEQVAAAKWAARTPIDDPAQEAAVLQSAREAAAARGLQADSVANLFAAEIAAAKTIQLGWGRRWLLYGYPPDQPVPDLAAIRPQIAALTPAIADALTRMSQVHCVAGARTRLLRDARRIITVAHATPALRTAIVDAILRVRDVSRPAPCGGV